MGVEFDYDKAEEKSIEENWRTVEDNINEPTR